MYFTPNLGQMLPVTHKNTRFGFVADVTARKKPPMNFPQRGCTCVALPRGYTFAVPPVMFLLLP